MHRKREGKQVRGGKKDGQRKEKRRRWRKKKEWTAKGERVMDEGLDSVLKTRDDKHDDDSDEDEGRNM